MAIVAHLGFCQCHTQSFCRQRTAALPVICIGNVTTGGTGKTPVTAFLYDRLCDAGYRPAILIRGYGAAVNAHCGLIHRSTPLMIAVTKR